MSLDSYPTPFAIAAAEVLNLAAKQYLMEKGGDSDLPDDSGGVYFLKLTPEDRLKTIDRLTSSDGIVLYTSRSCHETRGYRSGTPGIKPAHNDGGIILNGLVTGPPDLCLRIYVCWNIYQSAGSRLDIRVLPWDTGYQEPIILHRNSKAGNQVGGAYG